MVSPLYRVYQVAWNFSSTDLTTVFAVYALALLATLLALGSLSDHVGRRPMLALALLAEAAAALVFLTAHGLGDLYVGRVLQGVATGSAVGAVGAVFLDLQPQSRPLRASTVNTASTLGSLAIGALGASVLVQWAPAPTQSVFWVLFAASLAALAGVGLMAESGTRRPVRWAAFQPDVGVPLSARRAFLVAVPALVATFSLAGLYFSLGPSLAQAVARSHNAFWGGLVIFLICGAGTVTSIALRGLAARKAMIWGSAILAVGSAVTLAAIADHSTTTLLVGTVIAGIGVGLGFLGALRYLTSLATSERRGALISSIFVVSYLAFSVPVIAAGVAVVHFGLQSVAVVYSAGITTLATAATGAEIVFEREGGAGSPYQRSTRPCRHC